VQVPYGKFFMTPAVWAVITAHFCFNWGYYTLLAWLPSYFDLVLGIDVSTSSVLTLIPYLSMVLMTPFVGPTADGLIATGWSVTRVRKLCQGVSFAGPCTCMLALSLLTPPDGTAAAGNVSPHLTCTIVALLCAAFALSAWARAGLYCNHQDMSPKCAPHLPIFTSTHPPPVIVTQSPRHLCLPVKLHLCCTLCGATLLLAHACAACMAADILLKSQSRSSLLQQPPGRVMHQLLLSLSHATWLPSIPPPGLSTS
jgi:hypothetical protein